MALEELYRQRAKEAREKAAATSDDDIRRIWLEIARGFEWLADRPGRDPVWRVERVKPKK
jgi:hypothetical protein